MLSKRSARCCLILGGSADLAPSNLTRGSGSKAINEDAAGNYIHYGVREFGMTAIANGISLHGGFLPVHLHLPDVRGIRT